MKTKFLGTIVALAIFSFNAFAGDGYAVTAAGLTAILSSPEVQRAASPFYIESIRQFGEILPGKMTYILQFQRDDLAENRFCLVVSVEGLNNLKVRDVQKWMYGSRLCHN
jgi:hypothetical protein